MKLKGNGETKKWFNCLRSMEMWSLEKWIEK